jgi:D-alanyl-D-alanine carboxypeptidase (penicillin-binding protein 5/6)
MLYGLMLESYNDCAVAIAEHVAGNTENFAKLLNNKAKELGCKDTYFITPNGLDAEDEKGIHSTTAGELAKIMSYCICESSKKEEFLQITGTANYKFSNIEGTRTFQCQNRNSFLDMMNGAISGKTGYTGKAGYCYVGALELDGRIFVVSLLACGWPNHKNYKWQDTRNLMEYAIENYQYREVNTKEELPMLKVKGGIPKNQDIFQDATAEIAIDMSKGNQNVLLLREDEEAKVVFEYEKQVNAPVKKGTKIGMAIYYLGEEKLGEQTIIICEDVDKKTLQWYWSAILNLYLL